MNKLLLLLLLSLGLIGSAFSDFEDSIAGFVVLDHYQCETYDYIVIETRGGYTNAQVYRGYNQTYEGDIIYGDFHSYGFTEIYDKYGNELGRLWIDDYMVGRSTALEWCYGD